MPTPIASDHPLSSRQRAIFEILLDQFIPADPVRKKPSAADVGVLDHIVERNPNAFEEIARELDELETQAMLLHGDSYVNLDRELQDAVLNQVREGTPRFLMTFAMLAVEVYYLNDRVRVAIGLPARAPYPEGFTVPRGDLSLLEPVQKRGDIWRRT